VQKGGLGSADDRQRRTEPHLQPVFGGLPEGEAGHPIREAAGSRKRSLVPRLWNVGTAPADGPDQGSPGACSWWRQDLAVGVPG